jgi:hypothetical protein
MIFLQQPNKFTWVGVVLVLGSLVAIGIEKVKENQKVMLTSSSSDPRSSMKQRTSDLPSGSADSDTLDDHDYDDDDENNTNASKSNNGSARKRPTTKHADEETLELMVNDNAQGKAE